MGFYMDILNGDLEWGLKMGIINGDINWGF